MIPLTSDQQLTVPDDKGNKYEFKYLTALDDAVEFSALAKREREDREKFYKKAKAELPKNAGEKNIDIRAYELLIEDREANPRQYLSLCNTYINIFVVGWQGKGLLPFPKSGKPADAVRIFEKYKLYRLIQNNIAELTGLVFDEVKN